MTRFVAFAAAVFAAGSPVAGSAQRHPDTSLVVTAAWLARHLDDPSVVVLIVEHDHASYASSHIAGARYLDYGRIAVDRDRVRFEMPDSVSLANLAGSVG